MKGIMFGSKSPDVRFIWKAGGPLDTQLIITYYMEFYNILMFFDVLDYFL